MTSATRWKRPSNARRGAFGTTVGSVWAQSNITRAFRRSVDPMNLQQQRTLKTGDYIQLRGEDSESERADVRSIFRRNGCRSVRFEALSDGRLQAHGYLAELSGAEPV